MDVNVSGSAKKIVWTSRKDTIKKTLVVLVCLIATAVVIGVMDFAFNKIVELLASIPA
ncbi:MAG: preprotein translocase subunit SecE [Clostridiales bacterium]|nr:MAG: preprotein translocase subunit SecE [Clostridiales bacterium]